MDGHVKDIRFLSPDIALLHAENVLQLSGQAGLHLSNLPLRQSSHSDNPMDEALRLSKIPGLKKNLSSK